MDDSLVDVFSIASGFKLVQLVLNALNHLQYPAAGDGVAFLLDQVPQLLLELGHFAVVGAEVGQGLLVLLGLPVHGCLLWLMSQLYTISSPYAVQQQSSTKDLRQLLLGFRLPGCDDVPLSQQVGPSELSAALKIHETLFGQAFQGFGRSCSPLYRQDL